MKMISVPVITGLLALSSTVWAAENHSNTPHLETTIVTASRTEQNISDALAPVTVFEREDIQRIAPQDLQELLSRAVGVSFVRNGGRGSTTSLFLRGNQSNHTLVLIDGVRIGSATSGSAAFTNLPPELIERIEIVRGPRSTLYGSEAIGGVINIITRKYHDAQGLKPFLQLGVGTQGTVKGVAAISGGNARSQFNLTALAEETDGIDNTHSKTFPHGDDDGFEQQAFNFTASHKFSRRAEVFALVQRSDSESQYDGHNNAPYTDGRVSVANLRGEFQLTNVWRLLLSHGQSEDKAIEKYDYVAPGEAPPSEDIFKTTRTITSLQNDWQLADTQLLSVGAEQLDDKVDASLSYNKDSRKNDAIFVQWQAEFGPLNTALGWRNDDNEQFGSQNTRTASAGIDLVQGLRLIASYGEGFNAPTFNDLYYPGYGNPNLVPETSTNRELGLQGDAGWGRWSLNYFRNDVDNLIQYNPATFGPDQINAADINGYELVLSTKLLGWNIDANASLLDATDADSGLDLPRRAQQQLNIDMDRQWQHWGVNASLRLVSSRYDDTANNDEMPGYGLFDFGLSYQLSDALRLQLAVKNAFDKNYVIARHFSLGNYQTIGREALVSITYSPQ